MDIKTFLGKFSESTNGLSTRSSAFTHREDSTLESPVSKFKGGHPIEILEVRKQSKRHTRVSLIKDGVVDTVVFFHDSFLKVSLVEDCADSFELVSVNDRIIYPPMVRSVDGFFKGLCFLLESTGIFVPIWDLVAHDVEIFEHTRNEEGWFIFQLHGIKIEVFVDNEESSLEVRVTDLEGIVHASN